MKKVWIAVDVCAALAVLSMFSWAFLDLPVWAQLERGPDIRGLGIALFHIAPVFAAFIRRIE
jgi:hypothetical protein